MVVTVYTLGHGTLSADAFLAILQQYGIRRLVDVRAVPRSRHNPQFEKDVLSPYLRIRGIKYLHLKELGGWRRHVRPDPDNAGWRNASFRGFADYMQTPEFVAALTRLIHLARDMTTAIMCAETVPWRCHRSLIADALIVRGVAVIDLISSTSSKPHPLTPMARVEGRRITYPLSAPNPPPA
ncbi:DUF488 domain-containing protein [Geomonas sp. Red875]|uniref:DUF488 domain-containing protein n=1 Tax=Geomesophilobacter sediminis TaxID=2798584 RepID=A0A8J7LUT4_9BACT|nr:DUF488 domain-containing protein [Geomesophilobacter sediminis]